MKTLSDYIDESRPPKNKTESMFASFFRQMKNENDTYKKMELMTKLNTIAVHLSEKQMQRLIRRL